MTRKRLQTLKGQHQCSALGALCHAKNETDDCPSKNESVLQFYFRYHLSVEQVHYALGIAGIAL
jgi:hypothetical protein